MRKEKLQHILQVYKCSLIVTMIRRRRRKVKIVGGEVGHGRHRKGVPWAVCPTGTSCTKSWMLLRSSQPHSSGAFFWFFRVWPFFRPKTSGPQDTLDPPAPPSNPGPPLYLSLRFHVVHMFMPDPRLMSALILQYTEEGTCRFPHGRMFRCSCCRIR